MEELRHHLDYFTKDFTSFLDAIIVENEYGEFSFLEEIIFTFTVSETSIRSHSPLNYKMCTRKWIISLFFLSL